MILVGFLALIIVAVLSQIVLIKGTNFLGIIAEKYKDGIAIDLSSAEELKNKIIETSSDIIKGASVNSSGQVEVIGKTGTHLFYLENGNMKSQLIKYGFRISRIGRFLAWLKIVSKMKMANEINTIFENLIGNKATNTDNEEIIKSVSSKSKLTNILAVISIILIIFSVTSLPGNKATTVNTDVYEQTIQESILDDSSYTYKEVFNGFFANPIWEHFTGDENQEIVEFTGECSYQEKDVKVTVQYLITNETEASVEYELIYFDIDGEPQDLTTFEEMISAAIESYQS